MIFSLSGCAAMQGADDPGRTVAQVEARFGPADRSNPMQLSGVAHVWDPLDMGSDEMTCGLVVLATGAGVVAKTVPIGNWPVCT